MSRIIIRTTGSTEYSMVEEYINEEAALEGKYPERKKVKLFNGKVINRKYRRKKPEDDRV